VLRGPLWLQAGLPGVGLLVAAIVLRTIGRGTSTATADAYIQAFHDPEAGIDLRAVPGRLLASAATLASGGAMGFEGPSMYLGAAIGSWVQSRWSAARDRRDNNLLMVCGAAAGVAAIFKAPATGMVFALEVPYRQDLARRMLLPAMFSAAASYVVYVAVNGTTPLFPIGGTPPLDLRDLGGAAALGLLSSVGARGAAALLRGAKALLTRHGPALRLPVAGAGLVLAFVATRGLTGSSLSIGSGYGAIEWALAPGHAAGTIAVVFLLRLAATTLAVGGGGVGGLFVPLVVQGALLGAAVGGVVHGPDVTFFPVLGVAAFLGAGYRVPLAAVVFVAESTGRPGFVVPGLIAAATSQVLMGRASVSPYQEGTRTSLLQRRLALPVSTILRTDAATVPSDATVAELFEHHIVQLRLRTVPVVDGATYRGVVHLDDVIQLPRADWTATRVGQVAREDWPTAQVGWSLGDAVRAMEAADVDRVPVLDDGAFVGLVTMGELLKLDSILDTTEGVS
jgi:CIC family chloride channel protein